MRTVGAVDAISRNDPQRLERELNQLVPMAHPYELDHLQKLAAQRDNPEITAVLREHRARFNQGPGAGQERLLVIRRIIAAIHSGQPDIVDMELRWLTPAPRSDELDRLRHMAEQLRQPEIVVLLERHAAENLLASEKGKNQSPGARAYAFRRMTDAISQGQLQRMSDGLKDLSPPASPDELGRLLVVAAESGKVDILERLIQRGADLETRDDREWTALMNAAHHGWPDLVRRLLESGADADARSPGNHSALALASRSGLTHGQEYEDYREATRRSRAEIQRLLIAHGAGFDGVDQLGFTALEHAIRDNDPDAASMLLSRGASPGGAVHSEPLVALALEGLAQNIRDYQRAHQAIDLTKLLIAHGAPITQGQKARLAELEQRLPPPPTGTLAWAQRLIANGGDPNGQIEGGQTPLDLCKSADCIEYLLAQGSDLEALNGYGNTPLLERVLDSRPDHEVIRTLIRHGASLTAASRTSPPVLVELTTEDLAFALPVRPLPDEPDASGHRPLAQLVAHLERMSAEEAVYKIELLIEHGADPLQRDQQGNTLIHLLRGPRAAYTADKVLELLLDQGIDPNARNSAGETAAMAVLLRHSDESVMGTLLRHGLEVNQPVDDAGRTLLMRAARERDLGAVNLLLAYGADPNQRDSNGCDAICQTKSQRPGHGDQRAIVMRLIAAGGGTFGQRFATRFGLHTDPDPERQRILLMVDAIYRIPVFVAIGTAMLLFGVPPLRRSRFGRALGVGALLSLLVLVGFYDWVNDQRGWGEAGAAALYVIAAMGSVVALGSTVALGLLIYVVGRLRSRPRPGLGP